MSIKPLEKLKLIDAIGRELQSRMTFREINRYFETYGIPTDHEPSYNSKYVYVKEVLPKESDDIVLKIADELEIEYDDDTDLSVIIESDATFWKPGHFKLFISHLASYKEKISLLKHKLEKYGITAFVAHEDIEPTKEWQVEIEKGLVSMDAFCAVLMKGFKESDWTDQEVGFAFGRDVLVIPIRKGIDPYGFIGKYQGFQADGKNVGEVAHGIFKIISSHEKTKHKYQNILMELILLANSKNQAIELLSVLYEIDDFPKSKIENLRERIVENKNLKHPDFIKNFNKIARKHETRQLQIRDFQTKEQEDYDELPF
jgi:hypothetical protein